MTHRKKIINILIILVLTILFIAALFPVGNKLMKIIRTHAYAYAYFLPLRLKVEDTSKLPPAQAVPILRYHDVKARGQSSASVERTVFIDQMERLKQKGYKTISLYEYNQFLDGKFTLPPKPIIITFDDGRSDTFYAVDKVLKKLGFRAVIFIDPDGTQNNSLYLSPEEITRISKTDRYDIGLYAKGDSEYSAINQKGKNGYTISNLLWLKDKNRLEAVDEYKARIKAMLLKSKSDLERLSGREIISASFPFNYFGENSLNFKTAEEIYAAELAKIFKLNFAKNWPIDSHLYRSNYPLRGEDAFEAAKRMIINPQWSKSDFTSLIDGLDELSMPYQESFNNKFRWQRLYGNVYTGENELSISGSGSASIYLDGSRNWKNYDYEVIFNQAGLDDNTLSLTARLDNTQAGQSYASCQFSADSVAIKYLNDKNESALVNRINNSESYSIKRGTKLKMRVYDKMIQCFVDDKSVARAELNEIANIGGAGIKIWNPNGKDITVKISSVNVSSLDNLPSKLCQGESVKITVADGTLCRDVAELSDWLAIYDRYPLQSNKKVIYSYFNRGDAEAAKAILENQYKMSRFDPVTINHITWRENYFSDIYWRFNYYNLEPVRNLLAAWEKTGDSAYKDKLIEITESFIDKGINGPYSWDYHGAAFRTMTLINVWWKLREKNELPVALGIKILQSLKLHGDFLANPAHFEKDYNHGLDQSAALYLLAINFPDMPGANAWRELSSKRISGLLADIIDGNGVLVENSPYYHFYVLEKLWEINKYLIENNLSISIDLNKKINQMISYGAYILQPNLNIPTIGASIQRRIDLTGVYAEMAKSHPDLLYVLTEGAEGSKPANLNIQYPISGQTIFRSGWSKGDDYTNQTQIIFDIGKYRTNHSDLDALSFNLYSNGLALMPDAGLYTYEAGPYRTYFHGTKSHNTVVVDGKDQSIGEEIIGRPAPIHAGLFEKGDGYVYQSATHELYQGVSHQRSITMIENSTILIFDNLESASEHTYEQIFHLFPGAKISSDGLTLTARSNDPKQALTIRQFISDGVTLSTAIGRQNPPNGLCSVDYKIAVPCYSISYLKKGRNVSYITAIGIGQNPAAIAFDKNNNLLNVKTKSNSYAVKINKIKSAARVIEANKNFDLSQIYSAAQPADSLNAFDQWQGFLKTEDEEPTIINKGSVKTNNQENSLEIITPTGDSKFEVVKDVALDLSDKNLYFKIKIDDTANLRILDLYLSNNKWSQYAKYGVRYGTYNIDNVARNNEWLQFGVSKGGLRKENLGNWTKSDPNFDWSKIDSIKLVVASRNDKNIKINLKEFSLAPDQKEARAVINFDDGWSSVLEAAKIMEKYGLKGNISMITNNVNAKSFLTLDNLKTLQNQKGWSIASHSSLHKDAIEEYSNKNNLAGFENDLTDALQYLIQNNINSAPNWYIYPNGKTNEAIKNIVKKYYKFARATVSAPELYPFAEPLEVKVFGIYTDRADSKDLHDAISDAIKYKQTIFLMFHKFTAGAPAIYTELQLSEFEVMLKDIIKQGIKVVTLSELDKENNLPETKFIIHEASPQQFDLDISVNRHTN